MVLWEDSLHVRRVDASKKVQSYHSDEADKNFIKRFLNITTPNIIPNITTPNSFTFTSWVSKKNLLHSVSSLWLPVVPSTIPSTLLLVVSQFKV